MLLLPELWMEIVAVLALSALLSFLAYRLDLLTKSGCISAAAVGIIIGACGSLSWLILLIVFTLLGFAATLAGLSKKKEKGLQEGTHGERDYRNVLGVALPCCVFAFINLITQDSHYYLMMIGYISTIAVAAADTAASELGTKDERVYLITTFKRVKPGIPERHLGVPGRIRYSHNSRMAGHQQVIGRHLHPDPHGGRIHRLHARQRSGCDPGDLGLREQIPEQLHHRYRRCRHRRADRLAAVIS